MKSVDVDVHCTVQSHSERKRFLFNVYKLFYIHVTFLYVFFYFFVLASTFFYIYDQNIDY